MTLSDHDLDELEARYEPNRNGAAAIKQADDAARDIPALIAEVCRLRKIEAVVRDFMAHSCSHAVADDCDDCEWCQLIERAAAALTEEGE